MPKQDFFISRVTPYERAFLNNRVEKVGYKNQRQYLIAMMEKDGFVREDIRTN